MSCIRCHRSRPGKTPWLCGACFDAVTREKFVYDNGPASARWSPELFDHTLREYRRSVTLWSYEATRRIDQGLVAQPGDAPLPPAP